MTTKSSGYDHYCTVNDRHATWHPTKWLVGNQCPAYRYGKPCAGTLVATGLGSVEANKAAAAIGS